MPIATAPPRHPNPRISAGTSRPAIAPPAGTPVCLIEKVSETCDGGVARTRISELAGVVGP